MSNRLRRRAGLPTKTQEMMSETIVLECPYPLVTLGLKQVLGAAGYEVRSGHKGPAMEAKTPSLAVYVPYDEDVGEDVARRLLKDAAKCFRRCSHP